MQIFDKLREFIRTMFNFDISDNETQSRIISYSSGHLLTTSIVFSSMYDLIIQSIVRVIFALLIGIIGGVGGLFAKDIYDFLKRKLVRKTQ